MEAIDSIKIVQVDGLTGSGRTGGAGDVGGAGGTNLASSAVEAALRYRAQAPIIDGLMKEIGLDGSTLESPGRGRGAEAVERAGGSDGAATGGGEGLKTPLPDFGEGLGVGGG